jgi:hypothetical protein
LYQIGAQGDSVGYEIYDICRENGALVSTGHEHSYCRSKTMVDFRTQEVAENATADTIQLSEGSSVVWVSGVGGQQIRDSKSELRKKPWWAVALAADTKVFIAEGTNLVLLE